MVYRFCAFILLSTLGVFSVAAQTVSLSGLLVNSTTRQPVIGANIILVEAGRRTVSDSAGRFLFRNLQPGQYTVAVRHVAFGSAGRAVILKPGMDDSMSIAMPPAILPSEEIVVLSSRMSPGETRSPFPIDVQDHDRLIRQSSVTVPDALTAVPGVALLRDGTWETGISIRGLGRSNIVSLIDNTRIETATDIAGALSLVNAHDLERVETLKSSGSVLFGTGALGGVVQFVTRQPSFEEQSQLHAEATSDFTLVNHGGSQYAALEESTDRLALRVSGGYRSAGNTMTPLGMLPNSQYRDFTYSGSLKWKTAGEQSLYAFYQRAQAENTGIPGGSPIASQATASYKLARRQLFGVEYNLPNLSRAVPMVTFRLSRQMIERNVEIIQNPTLTLTPHATHSTTSAQVESRLTLIADDIFTVGVEAWQRSLDSRRERIDRLNNLTTGERPVPASSYFSGGVFAQNEWDIAPGTLSITAGARYDWIRVRNNETWNPQYVIASGVLQDPPPGERLLWPAQSAGDASWSAAAGIHYSLSPAAELTLLVSTAFRSPSLEERYQFIDLGSVVHLGNPHLLPERSTDLNAGFRLRGESWNAKAELFLNGLRNLVVEVPGTYEGRPAYINANVGQARLYGYEVSAEKALTPWLAAEGWIAFVRGEDRYQHADLPQIAPLNGSLEMRGDIPRFGKLRLSCTFAATQDRIAAGEMRTPGYAVMNFDAATIPLDLGQCMLVVRTGVLNVLNRAYRNHLSTLRKFIRAEPGSNGFLSFTVTV